MGIKEALLEFGAEDRLLPEVLAIDGDFASPGKFKEEALNPKP